jgi:hypothetical protein
VPRPRLLDAYRRTGADPPFGDPRRAHGLELEGYYWRLTDFAAGRVVVALAAVCQAADGPWGLVALAAHPGGFVRWALSDSAHADPSGLGVVAGDALAATADSLRVDLGPDARVDVRFSERLPWRRRAFGALGAAHAVPGLPQYWHPHMLDATVAGEATLGGERLDLSAAKAYAEKNWGPSFSEHWWWGQAHGFADPEVCVAFAGGRVELAGVAVAPTALVLQLGGELLRFSPPFARMTAAVGEGSWRIRARSARHQVELEGDDAGHAPVLLPVPVPALRRVEVRSRQHLAGHVRVRVTRSGRTLFAGDSQLAGLEHGVPVS